MNTVAVNLPLQGLLFLLVFLLSAEASVHVPMYNSKELLMYFQMKCPMRCKYGFETDVEGRPLCKCHDPCKNIYCLGGTKCVIEMPKSCHWESCRPSATCKKRGSRRKQKNIGKNLYNILQADDATTTASKDAQADRCMLPVSEEATKCKKLRRRWHFDPDSGKCVKFRGCKVGGNNFGRKKRCKRKCIKKQTKARRKGRRGSRRASRRSKE